MKFSRSERSATEDVAEPEVVDTEDEVDHSVTLAKGRATPKRRDSQGKRGPVRAPQTRKEASARQRQLAREQKVASATARPRSAAEQRAALRRGDPDALPRRDQGATRKLARDWVDSRRMLSNYLLMVFPIYIIGIAVRVPAIEAVALVLLLVCVGEWFLTGRRIRSLAVERHGSADGTNLSIGWYAGSRAYLPRRWRLPRAQVELGDEV